MLALSCYAGLSEGAGHHMVYMMEQLQNRHGSKKIALFWHLCIALWQTSGESYSAK